MAEQDARLVEIRARLEKATPGPWHWTDQPDGILSVAFGALNDAGEVDQRYTNVKQGYALCAYFPGSMEDYEGEDLHNAEFIAHCRDDVAYLLALLAEQDARAGARGEEGENERLLRVEHAARRFFTFTHGGYRWEATDEKRDALYDALTAQ